MAKRHLRLPSEFWPSEFCIFESHGAALSESQDLRKIARGGAGEMSDDLYTLVGYQIEVIADWRRRQAEYFPSNDQNRRAAKELERLAAEIEQLEGSSVHKQISLATDRLKNEDWFAMSESVYAELRSVGFDSAHESGLRFLEWYCDRLRGRCATLP
jgi:hypothetical protein